MSITVQHQKEALGQAYVRAVIAKAGFNFGKSEHDYGYDGTIKEVVNRGGRYVESCFGINFQLKSSCDVTFENGHVVYDLESKNYNDLGKISEPNCPVAICNSLFVALYKSVASSSLTILPS